jgi:hypothetical protein
MARLLLTIPHKGQMGRNGRVRRKDRAGCGIVRKKCDQVRKNCGKVRIKWGKVR